MTTMTEQPTDPAPDPWQTGKPARPTWDADMDAAWRKLTGPLEGGADLTAHPYTGKVRADAEAWREEYRPGGTGDKASAIAYDDLYVRAYEAAVGPMNEKVAEWNREGRLVADRARATLAGAPDHDEFPDDDPGWVRPCGCNRFEECDVCEPSWQEGPF